MKDFQLLKFLKMGIGEKLSIKIFRSQSGFHPDSATHSSKNQGYHVIST